MPMELECRSRMLRSRSRTDDLDKLCHALPRVITNRSQRPISEELTFDKLPPSSTTRWVVRRKAEVVAAVDGGLVSIDEACERYNVTLEELASWMRAIDRSGLHGLRITRLQHYRDHYARRSAV